MKMLTPFLWIIIGVAVGYLCLLGILYAFQSHLIYHPTKALPISPKSIGLSYEDVNFEAEDGTSLHGWYVPHEDAKATVLFQHGNTGNISGRLETIDILHQLDLNVFIYDYRGYGKSDGKPSEEGTYQDAMAAWKYLTSKLGIRPNEIILMGRSLGGGVTSWLATQVQPAAVIMESTFTSAPDLAADLYPVFPTRSMIKFQYANIDRVGQITAPIMLAHSPDDDLIPFAHGRSLFELANEPKHFFEMQGDHGNGFLETGDAYWKNLDKFVDEVFKKKKVRG